MYLSFAARVRDADHVLQNNFPDVGVLQARDEVAGIIGTSGDDDAGEQRAQPRNHKGDTPKEVQIDPRSKADKDRSQNRRQLRGESFVLLFLQHFNDGFLPSKIVMLHLQI